MLNIRFENVDVLCFRCDKIIPSHNQGLYLCKTTLAVLSVQHQTLTIFHVSCACFTESESEKSRPQCGRVWWENNAEVRMCCILSSIKAGKCFLVGDLTNNVLFVACLAMELEHFLVQYTNCLYSNEAVFVLHKLQHMRSPFWLLKELNDWVLL